MLAKQNRLTAKADFDNLKKNGKVVQSECFALSFFKRKDSGPSRFGFIVSMKVSQHATFRNKAKRGMSEGVRHMLVYIQDGVDCVFLARPSIVKRYASDLIADVKKVFEDAKLLK